MTSNDITPPASATSATPLSATGARTTRILPLHGQTQPYAWGSPTAIPQLLGVTSDGSPVAELWLGTHPVAPSTVSDATADGGTEVGGTEVGDTEVGGGARRPAGDVVGSLPFLLKVLAADKALSLQVHPDLAQARAGFDAEQAVGVALDDPRRRYRDRNHKPELIVALTPFRALAGVREPARTLAVVDLLGPPALVAAFRPLAEDPAGGAARVLRTLLTMPPDPARALVRDLVAAARRAGADPAADGAAHGGTPAGAPTHDGGAGSAAGTAPAVARDLARAADLVGRLAAAHPGDVGIAAALLLNDVTLRPGEGLFQPARLLHAYVCGVGIEIMATSDNVLRGGLTPKHIDVDELLRVLDPTPSAAPVLAPRPRTVGPGGLLRGWDVPVGDFALTEAICAGGPVEVGHPTVLLAVDGQVEVSGIAPDGSALVPLPLGKGRSAVVTGPATVTLTGAGRVFLATPGAQGPIATAH